MRSIKILSVFTIVLMLMNVALVFVILNNKDDHRPPHPPRAGFKFEVINAIGFDEKQAEAYDELTQQHHIAMVKLEEARGEQLALRFSSLSGNDSLDEEAILRELESLERQRVEITYSHFEDVRALCRPDQIEAYNLIVKRAVQALLSPEANRRPPMRK